MATTTWWVHAAPREAAGAPSLPGRVVEVGVGKTEATLRLTKALVSERPGRVIVFGVAGAYPASGLDVGDLCVVTRDVLADEGVQTPEEMLALDVLGLGTNGPFLADEQARLCGRMASHLGFPECTGATVSTCSGTDALSTMRHTQTWAAVETMEGAAIGRVCQDFGVPWAQLRVIGDRTGDRGDAGWDLDGALSRLHAALGRLVAEPSVLG